MKRYEEIDILKGIAVISMVIFHVFYFPNQYGFKEIEYDTFPLKVTAKVAQIIFITCVGINLVFSYYISQEKKQDKKQYIKKQLYRIGKLAFCALFMTLFTYFVFGYNFVKFGILHFVAFSSLLLVPFVNNMSAIYSFLVIITVLYFLVNQDRSMFSGVPPKTAFISGFYFNYPALDHFPLIPWILLILIGIILGHLIIKYEPELPDGVKNNELSYTLQGIGKHSLEVYMIHWLVIYLIFCHIYPQYRNTPVLSFR
jgi:uncharacterized membrane protein